MSDECACGRLRPTAEDWDRWSFGESTRGDKAAMLARFAWSRARCFESWPCGTRRRWASDTHIGAAREVFARYLADEDRWS